MLRRMDLATPDEEEVQTTASRASVFGVSLILFVAIILLFLAGVLR